MYMRDVERCAGIIVASDQNCKILETIIHRANARGDRIISAQRRQRDTFFPLSPSAKSQFIFSIVSSIQFARRFFLLTFFPDHNKRFRKRNGRKFTNALAPSSPSSPGLLLISTKM